MRAGLSLHGQVEVQTYPRVVQTHGRQVPHATVEILIENQLQGGLASRLEALAWALVTT